MPNWLDMLRQIQAPARPAPLDPAGVTGVRPSLKYLLQLAPEYSQPTGDVSEDARRQRTMTQSLMEAWQLERERMRDPRTAYMLRMMDQRPELLAQPVRPRAFVPPAGGSI